MNKYYLNDWENKDQEHIFDEFGVKKEERNVNILFATYNYEDWTGDAFLIVEKDGKLFEVHAGHCSCYGLEEQFTLEETNVEAIEYYINEGYFGHGYRDKLSEFIKEYKKIKTPHERLLELGFVVDDETNYSISYMFNGLEIILFKKEKTYQTYVYQDNYNPIDLELAEILVDYLKGLENE